MRQRGRAYEDLYRCLSTKEGEKDIYRMARARDRKTRDFNQVKCIKDEREQLLVKEDEIRQGTSTKSSEYFDKLFNGENTDTTFQLDDSFDDTNRRVMWGRSYSRTRRARDVRRAAERARDQATGASEANSEPESG